jgi:hypothetical protein
VVELVVVPVAGVQAPAAKAAMTAVAAAVMNAVDAMVTTAVDAAGPMAVAAVTTAADAMIVQAARAAPMVVAGVMAVAIVVAARVVETSSHRSGVKISISLRPMRSVEPPKSTKSAVDRVPLEILSPTSVGLTSASLRNGSTKALSVTLPKALSIEHRPPLGFVGSRHHSTMRSQRS